MALSLPDTVRLTLVLSTPDVALAAPGVVLGASTTSAYDTARSAVALPLSDTALVTMALSSLDVAHFTLALPAPDVALGASTTAHSGHSTLPYSVPPYFTLQEEVRG